MNISLSLVGLRFEVTFMWDDLEKTRFDYSLHYSQWLERDALYNSSSFGGRSSFCRNWNGFDRSCDRRSPLSQEQQDIRFSDKATLPAG